MIRVFILLSLFIIFAAPANAQPTANKYDSVLAKKLNADDYGMKNYVFVILKTGSNTAVDKVVEDSLFHGHMNNIQRLATNGKLVVAGPFGKNNDNYRGLFILNTTSLDEAKALLETDPAIKAKLLEPELYLWYGSAALQETLKIHEKIQKVSF